METRFAVIIAGGRDFDDYGLLERKCSRLFANRRPTAIISGGARGADKLGQQYADAQGIPCVIVPAKWDLYGKQAGYLRNQAMLKQADALVAFWDGHSRGTRHMIQITKDAGLPVRIIRYEKER